MEKREMDKQKKGELASLNVGGQVHQTLWSTLEKLPESRLGRLASATSEEERQGLVDKFADNSYFFDRQPSFFSEILNYYRTGELWIPEDVCPTTVSTELEYWGIQENEMMSYCLDRLLERREELTGHQLDIKEKEVEGGTVWKILEKPDSSNIAKVYTVISCGVLLLATLVLVLNTMPSLQHTSVSLKKWSWDNPLQLLEIPCIIFFIIELIIRCVAAPDKKRFLLDPLNILDAAGNLAFIIELITVFVVKDASLELLRILRIMRVVRIVRFIRECKSIQCIRYVLKHSVMEILVLTLFLFYGVLMFATLGYYAEREENDSLFTSIPASMWWSIVTMTTVGFGDVTPVTATGKVIGSLAAVSAVFVMVLPIPFFIHSASEFYKADEAARRRQLRTKQSKLDKE